MKKFDVYAIGNALVDSEYQVSEALLQQSGVEKRHMTLIDAPRRAELLQHMHGVASHRTGGGSAGNTIVAVAQFGGKAFYSCRVAEDELGAFYTQDLAHHGVATNLSHTRAPHGDAERSMSTFLGATADLDHTALHPQDIERSRVYYMEGYLAASPTGVDAALQGRAIAHRAGVALALTLSDMSMINFCRPGLEAMVGGSEEAGRLEYLFCNEEEAQVWCGSQDLDAVCAQISKLARVVCLTRSAKGCIVLEGGQRTEVPAVPVKALDSNGAGDMFAGAFLYAVTQGYSHVQAAALGNRAAARVVGQYGNRLSSDAVAEVMAGFKQGLAA